MKNKIKPGDIILIESKPKAWNSYLADKCPFDLSFPKVITVKKVIRTEYKSLAVHCEEDYGWDVEAIEEAGYEVLTELPDNWMVKLSQDNQKKFNKYVKPYLKGIYPGDIVNYFYTTNQMFWERYDDFIELTIKQFKTLTNKIENRKITNLQALEIIDSACGSWKEKLLKKWDLRNDIIEISEDFYQEMRDACTPKQNQLFDEIFKDNFYLNLTPLKIKNCEIFDEDLIKKVCDNRLLMEIREYGEFQNKGFWLSDDFNWEIKKDSKNLLVLVPTRKK